MFFGDLISVGVSFVRRGWRARPGGRDIARLGAINGGAAPERAV
jgi:hypothetical protein